METLAVREGDRVEARELLFTVDAELQQADLAEVQEASLTNAQQAYDRAATFSRPRPAPRSR